tara:strand:- start:407 stop:1060 length:654 start_codon:yes stop_codon:yes gene_type:complete
VLGFFVYKFKYHYYSKLRNIQLFLNFFYIFYKIKNNEKIIKIDDKLSFTFFKHIEKNKNCHTIDIFKDINKKLNLFTQEITEIPYKIVNNIPVYNLENNKVVNYKKYFYFNEIENAVNKKILKESIVFNKTLFENISYIELVFYENQKWKDYYILEKTIYINNNFEYQGQMQYQKIVKNYYFIIHKDYLNEYLINFEKENLIYIPNIQKNIDKISNF